MTSNNSNLFQASNEWMTRPDDERFWTLREAYEVAEQERISSGEGTVRGEDLRVEADGGDLLLRGPNSTARLTNWSFGQLCGRAGAPAGYLSGLPATLAAQNINHGLKERSTGETKVLVSGLRPYAPPGEKVIPVARALTSGYYERLFDSFFLKGFAELEAHHGWRTPPARPAPGTKRIRIATEDDVLRGKNLGGLSIKVGDEIGPAGIYRGDRDMFIFMIDDNHVIEAKNGEMLARGFFFWNSEVGAKSYGAMTFLYRAVCGNHIVWGSKVTSEIRFRHMGSQTEERAKRVLEVEVKRYMESGISEEKRRIDLAQDCILGKDMKEVIEALLGRKGPGLPAKTLEAAYKSTEKNPEDGNPRSAWGMAQGVTRLSQSLTNQDQRAAMDAKAGKILEFAF